MIIAFHNFKGGVGSSTLAANTCLRAQERGLTVIAGAADDKGDLKRWLENTEIPFVDLSLDEVRKPADLMIIDIVAIDDVIDHATSMGPI